MQKCNYVGGVLYKNVSISPRKERLKPVRIKYYEDVTRILEAEAQATQIIEGVNACSPVSIKGLEVNTFDDGSMDSMSVYLYILKEFCECDDPDVMDALLALLIATVKNEVCSVGNSKIMNKDQVVSALKLLRTDGDDDQYQKFCELAQTSRLGPSNVFDQIIKMLFPIDNDDMLSLYGIDTVGFQGLSKRLNLVRAKLNVYIDFKPVNYDDLDKRAKWGAKLEHPKGVNGIEMLTRMVKTDKAMESVVTPQSSDLSSSSDSSSTKKQQPKSIWRYLSPSKKQSSSPMSSGGGAPPETPRSIQDKVLNELKNQLSLKSEEASLVVFGDKNCEESIGYLSDMLNQYPEYTLVRYLGADSSRKSYKLNSCWKISDIVDAIHQDRSGFVLASVLFNLLNSEPDPRFIPVLKAVISEDKAFDLFGQMVRDYEQDIGNDDIKEESLRRVFKLLIKDLQFDGLNPEASTFEFFLNILKLLGLNHRDQNMDTALLGVMDLPSILILLDKMAEKKEALTDFSSVFARLRVHFAQRRLWDQNDSGQNILDIVLELETKLKPLKVDHLIEHLNGLRMNYLHAALASRFTQTVPESTEVEDVQTRLTVKNFVALVFITGVIFEVFLKGCSSEGSIEDNFNATRFFDVNKTKCFDQGGMCYDNYDELLFNLTFLQSDLNNNDATSYYRYFQGLYDFLLMFYY